MTFFLRSFAIVIVTLMVCGHAHAGDKGKGLGPPGDTPPPTVVVIPVVVPTDRDDDYYDDVPVSMPYTPEAYATGCDTSGGTVGIKGGGFGISFPTYPCTVLRTRQAIEATYESDGFIQGRLTRVFLRGRLITKGIFSVIFGLVGLG